MWFSVLYKYPLHIFECLSVSMYSSVSVGLLQLSMLCKSVVTVAWQVVGLRMQDTASSCGHLRIY